MEPNLSFLIGALAWLIKITKVVPFESGKDPFLALFFSLSSSMISLLLCLLPSAILLTLTIWPFGPHPPRSLLRWRPPKELCFDWSAGMITGIFLSIRANARPPSQWIPTKLTFYSTTTSVSTPLQLFSGSPLTTLFFPKHVLSRLRCNGHSLLLGSYLSRIGESGNLDAAPADTRPRTPLISLCAVQLRTFCVAHSLATLCLSATSGLDPGKLPGLWGCIVSRHALSLGKGR